MTELQQAEVLSKFKNAHELNNMCFECQAATPNWSSINNGILICLGCAGVHRGLGV